MTFSRSNSLRAKVIGHSYALVNLGAFPKSDTNLTQKGACMGLARLAPADPRA